MSQTAVELAPESIREFRKAESMTQLDLAQLLGVGLATVNRWERGEAKPTGTAETILKTVIAPRLELGIVSASAVSSTAPLGLVGVAASTLR